MTRPFRHAMYEARWSRRNLWALLGLPVALVAALAASSDRVDVLYRQEGLHSATRGSAGDWTTHTGTYLDGEVERERRVDVRLDGVSTANAPWETSAYPPAGLTVPPGSQALAVSLSFRADPRMPVSVCRLTLRDADGNRYDYLPEFGAMEQPNSPCVPPDTPGPIPAVGDIELGDSGPPRPTTWSVRPVVVLPEGVRVTEVDIWWERPYYLALSV